MANHGRILKSAMNGNKMENAERLTKIITKIIYSTGKSIIMEWIVNCENTCL
jgi:hypothetical protein